MTLMFQGYAVTRDAAGPADRGLCLFGTKVL